MGKTHLFRFITQVPCLITRSTMRPHSQIIPPCDLVLPFPSFLPICIHWKLHRILASSYFTLHLNWVLGHDTSSQPAGVENRAGNWGDESRVTERWKVNTERMNIECWMEFPSSLHMCLHCQQHNWFPGIQPELAVEPPPFLWLPHPSCKLNWKKWFTDRIINNYYAIS